jgi:hypothetical protein
MTHEVIQQALAALEFLCKRCEEQGFYSPTRQPLVIETMKNLVAALDAENEWQQVPKEPTAAMMLAFRDHASLHSVKEAYKKMLAAAPKREAEPIINTSLFRPNPITATNQVERYPRREDDQKVLSAIEWMEKNDWGVESKVDSSWPKIRMDISEEND